MHWKSCLFLLLGVIATNVSGCNISIGEPNESAGPADLAPGAVDANQITQVTTKPPGEVTPTDVLYTGPSFSKVGRFDTSDPNVTRFNFQGSKLGVSFTGTSLRARFADSGLDDYDLIMDGNRIILYVGRESEGCLPTQVPNQGVFDANTSWGACVHGAISAQPNTYLLAKNLSPGNHTAWFVKRTEFYKRDSDNANKVTGTTSFYEFILDANARFLAPPPAKTRRLIFSADSGFTGLSSTRLEVACGYEAVNQDAYMSIPEDTGRLLDADSINVACSGMGVYDSVLDSNPAHTLPVVFDQTLGWDAGKPWNYATDSMDVVVLGAGGLDLWGNAGSGAFRDPAKFHSTFVAWLTSIRAHYPKALIIAAITHAARTNDIVTLRNAFEAAKAERAAAGDTNIEVFSYFTNDPNGYTFYDDLAVGQKLGWGCAYHPSAAGAEWLAAKLAAFIRQKKGW